MYRIEFSHGAAKQLGVLPGKIQKRIANLIDSLVQDPRPSGCVKLRGSEDIWRLRVGDYRVLYQLRDQEILVLVLRVAHRREAYKRQP